MTLKKVTPLPGAAPYIGGKRHLASHIISIISAIPHDLYAEPFIGMGGVFFRRSQIPPREVINDFSRDVVIFFRVVQRHFPELHRTLRLSFSSRAVFDQLIDTPTKSLTDVEQAARFYYLQRNCYGGKVNGRNFAVSMERSRFNISKLKRDILLMHRRLAAVLIECLPYGQFIERYDTPKTLFYLDPPYWGCENYYGKGVFSKADFTRLADQLAGIKGKFLMSLNDRPEVRQIFKAFKIEAVDTVYSVSGKIKPVGEVIITNARW